MVTVTIDDSRMRQRLNELHDCLIGAGKDGDAAIMIENEARLFLKGVINLTTPPGFGMDAKTQGQRAVVEDMHRLFTPIDEEFLNIIGSQFGPGPVDKWITSDGKKEHIKWDKIDPTGAGMPAYHYSRLNNRGRVRSQKKASAYWYAPYVVSFQDFGRYVAKIVSHVGRKKAAWGIAYAAIGGNRLPAWIRKHVSGAMGNVINGLATKNAPSVTMSSHAPGVSQDVRIIQDQMRIRAEAIGRKMKRILNGYATDMKYSRVITRKEAMSLSE